MKNTSKHIPTYKTHSFREVNIKILYSAITLENSLVTADYNIELRRETPIFSLNMDK